MDGENNTHQEVDSDDVPPHVWAIIHEFLLGQKDSKLNLREPHFRPAVANIYPFIVFMYSLLIIVGLFANILVFVHIILNKLYTDPTYSFIINNVISDIIKCVFILPLSLYVLLIQNWMLGELLCSFLPMLQDIPMHTTTLTFLLMAWDRFRFVRNPNKPRMPAFVCTIGTWLTSVCLVLPYPIYIIYIDLGKHIDAFEGVGLCIVNLVDDMQEYLRGIFLVMYAGPLATISYLHVKVSRELQSQQTSQAVIMFEASRNSRDVGGGGGGSRSRTDSHSTTTDFRSSRGDCDRSSQYSRSSYRDHHHHQPAQLHHVNDNVTSSNASFRATRYESEESELDVRKERRTQKYLVPMVTLYGIFLCPLMILRLARLAVLETYDNTGHFDITYTTLVWVGFLPTCSTPILYAVWQMSRSSKERLRGYLRFSNRKLRQSCETVLTTAGTPAVPRAKCSHVDAIINQVDDGHSDNNSLQQDFASS